MSRIPKVKDEKGQETNELRFPLPEAEPLDKGKNLTTTAQNKETPADILEQMLNDFKKKYHLEESPTKKMK